MKHFILIPYSNIFFVCSPRGLSFSLILSLSPSLRLFLSFVMFSLALPLPRPSILERDRMFSPGIIKSNWEELLNASLDRGQCVTRPWRCRMGSLNWRNVKSSAYYANGLWLTRNTALFFLSFRAGLFSRAGEERAFIQGTFVAGQIVRRPNRWNWTFLILLRQIDFYKTKSLRDDCRPDAKTYTGLTPCEHHPKVPQKARVKDWKADKYFTFTIYPHEAGSIAF